MKQYDAMIVTTIREALAADRLITIRHLIERFDAIHGILTEDFQMWKAILSYKFDFKRCILQKYQIIATLQ